MEKKVGDIDICHSIFDSRTWVYMNQYGDTIAIRPSDLPALIAALQEIEGEVKGE